MFDRIASRQPCSPELLQRGWHFGKRGPRRQRIGQRVLVGSRERQAFDGGDGAQRAGADLAVTQRAALLDQRLDGVVARSSRSTSASGHRRR